MSRPAELEGDGFGGEALRGETPEGFAKFRHRGLRAPIGQIIRALEVAEVGPQMGPGMIPVGTMADRARHHGSARN